MNQKKNIINNNLKQNIISQKKKEFLVDQLRQFQKYLKKKIMINVLLISKKILIVKIKIELFNFNKLLANFN